MIKQLVLLCFLSSNFLFAQYTCNIEGKVTSRSTGEPLENVNVYISGTTRGSTTDKSGLYKISNVPSGSHKIVASIVGYKSQSLIIHLKEGMLEYLQFNLTELSYELRNVVVTAAVPKEWKKNLEEFKEYFLGDSPFASDCKIVNPEVINLTKNDTSGLSADASQPIIIINNALGYKILCSLTYFNWNEKYHRTKYLENSYYTELKDPTGNLKEDWIKNRKKAYDDSFVHFIRSLINDDLSKEDYDVSLDKIPILTGKRWPLPGRPEFKKLDDGGIEMNFNYYLKVAHKSYYYSTTEISWIKLTHPNVKFDKYGYAVEPFSCDVYGFWSLEGIANMLPKYYNP